MAFNPGDKVVCGCACHKGQEGVVECENGDGSLVSISLPHDNITLPADWVQLKEAVPHG